MNSIKSQYFQIHVVQVRPWDKALAFSFQKSLTRCKFGISIGVLVQLHLWISPAKMLLKDTIIWDDKKHIIHHKVIGILLLWHSIAVNSKLKILLVGFD